jgi:hypothetical protein
MHYRKYYVVKKSGKKIKVAVQNKTQGGRVLDEKKLIVTETEATEILHRLNNFFSKIENRRFENDDT